jgi:hypothetical protein
MTTVRLDVKTEAALRRLTLRRGQTKSEVIRDAIARLAGEEDEQVTAAQRLRSFIGVVDSGGQQLSVRTGRRRQISARRRWP